MELNFSVKLPTECTEEEVQGFKHFVLKGGEVVQNGLEGRIANAHILGFCFNGDALVGIAALKRPNVGYRNGVFAKAACICNVASFEREVGWAFTDDRYRGKGIFSTILFELLKTSVNYNVFATSRVTNQDVHRILEKLNFVRCGNTYPGRNEDIILFVKKANSTNNET